MKLWHAVFAGLLGLAATSGVAEAQWSGDLAWRDDRYDDRFDDRYDGRPDLSGATLARAAHALSDESARLADIIHAIAPRSHLARDAMGVALVAERFHETIESGAPPRVIASELRRLRREIRQLTRMADWRMVSVRSPHIERQLDRTMQAYAMAEDALRDARVHHRYRGDAYYGQVRAVPPAVAIPVAPVRPRPRYEVRVGF